MRTKLAEGRVLQGAGKEALHPESREHSCFNKRICSICRAKEDSNQGGLAGKRGSMDRFPDISGKRG